MSVHVRPYIPNGTEDTKGFQPDQKLLLQESMQDRGDGMCVDRYRARIKEVLLPRVTRISQSFIDVLFGPLLQVFDLGIRDGTREITHVLQQPSAH